MKHSFADLLQITRGADWKPPATLFAIDPGETCGWAVFRGGHLSISGQQEITTMKDSRLEVGPLWDLIMQWQPNIVVMEGYRVYASKAAAHTWNALYTPKLIGAMEAVCDFRGIPVVIQMASVKAFCTNDKLKAWGFYQKAQPHAIDAIRHGCYYLLFHERGKG